MNNAQARLITELVNQYMHLHPGFNIAADGDFLGLITNVMQHPDAADQLVALWRVDIWVVTAMAALGPQGIPPAQARRELLRKVAKEMYGCRSLLRHYPRECFVLEICVAYGCGASRTVAPNQNGWAGRWSGANECLTEWCRWYLNRADIWLRRNVTGYGAMRPYSPDLLLADSFFLVRSLYIGESPVDLIPDAGGNIMTTKRTPADGTSEIVANDFNADVPAGSNFVFTVDKPVGLLAPRGRDRQEVGYLLPSGLKVIVKSGESYTTMSFSGQHAVNIPQVRLMDNESAEFFATYVPLAPAHRAVQTPITIMVFECTCGRDRCEELHRIENWKSNQQVMKHNGQKIPLSLRSFIASAVIGPLRKLKPGSIVEGMYFAFLTREFGIRKGTVGQVASGGHGFEIHNARIVVPPAYVCRKLCICTNNGCRHGFDYPTIQQIKHANKCTNCDKPLLGLGHLLNGNNDLLTIARYIQDWQWDNQQNGRCNICNRPIKMWIWCPRCRATTNSGIQTLPRRESIVWILIF